MPAMPRPKGRATKIAMRLLGKDNSRDNKRRNNAREKMVGKWPAEELRRYGGSL